MATQFLCSSFVHTCIAHPSQPPARQAKAERPSAAEIWAKGAPPYVQILLDLADPGAAIVSIVDQRVRMQADEPSHKSILAEIYLPFDTPPGLDRHSKFVREATESMDALTRSIRRNIMLAEKIAAESARHPTKPQPTRTPLLAECAPDLHASNLDTPNTDTNVTSDRIRSEIEDALHRNEAKGDHERQDSDGTEAESLNADRPERLDEPDPEDDRNSRPIAHITSEICRDLGLDALPEPNAQSHRPSQNINSPLIAPLHLSRQPQRCQKPLKRPLPNRKRPQSPPTRPIHPAHAVSQIVERRR